VHQAEQVEGNQEQDAEQDRNQHDRGRKARHTRNVTGLDGTWLGMPPAATHVVITGASTGIGRSSAGSVATRNREGAVVFVPCERDGVPGPLVRTRTQVESESLMAAESIGEGMRQ